MRAPSEKALLQAFRSLSPQDAKLIRALARAVDAAGITDPLEELVDTRVPATSRYAHAMYSNPYRSTLWRVTVALHAMNEILGTYGVEALAVGPRQDSLRPPRYEYLNMGGTYATTLIYDRQAHALAIGSWGDLVERHQPRRSRMLIDR